MKNKNKYLSIRRDINIVNWLGLYTLYLKEVKRFTNVFLQTVTAPMITTLLFVVVFSVAIDRSAGIKKEIYEIPLMPADLSIAIENTTTNNNVVTIGAVIV